MMRKRKESDFFLEICKGLIYTDRCICDRDCGLSCHLMWIESIWQQYRNRICWHSVWISAYNLWIGNVVVCQCEWTLTKQFHIMVRFFEMIQDEVGDSDSNTVFPHCPKEHYNLQGRHLYVWSVEWKTKKIFSAIEMLLVILFVTLWIKMINSNPPEVYPSRQCCEQTAVSVTAGRALHSYWQGNPDDVVQGGDS